MFNSHQITFGQLRNFLVGLNFAERKGKNALVFEHPESGTVLIFREYQASEKVHTKDLMVVRRRLDESGLMSQEDFEHWLHEAAV